MSLDQIPLVASAQRFSQGSHILYEILIAFKLFLLKVRSMEVSFYPRNEYPVTGVDIRIERKKKQMHTFTQRLSPNT